MKKTNIKNGILLFLAASIWGMAFVAQRVAADYIEPFTFNAVRCLLGGLVLIPVYAAFQMREADEARESEISGDLAIPAEPNGKQTDTGSTQTHQNGKWAHLPKLPLKGGLVCGLFLFAGSMLQQYGIAYTTVGKAGFITAFYIVLVPILGLFFHKRVRLLIW
ncbi:MAG: DMT family transporter, partial [Lachnospiraceae bacterium]|nr:DMT family transporter [Lachnospiraceae bacterium]